MGFLITATDTDAGKTFVSCRILEALRAEGFSVCGFKPICCGERTDVALLQHSAQTPEISHDEMNPIWFKSAVAPLVAAMVENTPIDEQSILNAYKRLSKQYKHVIVEGAGGWKVPISKNYSFAQLAKDLNLPIILVVNNRLGALNHALLTIESIENSGLNIAGIVMNTQQEEQDLACVTNANILEDLTGIPILIQIIPHQEEIEAWPFIDLLEQR